ncbi:MAG TPA: hypothetical protein VHL56_03875, partial [Candidatus Limnocylindrales bacterium]|nr:hypothetical protein [Candidatus Limnocylindrales bacterium]
RKERERRAALEALAGEALEEGIEFNPFLQGGDGRPADEEEAVLIGQPAAVSDDEEFNPFLAEAKASGSEDSEPEL